MLNMISIITNRRTFLRSIGGAFWVPAVARHVPGRAKPDAESLGFENPKIRVTFDKVTGSVVRIANNLTGEVYNVVSEPFHLYTTFGEIAATDCRLTGFHLDGSNVNAEYEKGPIRVGLRYTLASNAHFFEKQIEISSLDGIPFGILALGIEKARFTPDFRQIIKNFCTGGRGYSGFYDMCPTAMFLRTSKGGIFLGVENPVFQMMTDGKEFWLWCDVGLKVEAGQKYVSEPEFVGVYSLRGKECRYDEIKPGVSWFRPISMLPPNPDHSRLDWGEIEAMQQCVESRSPAYTSSCLTALNNWYAANYVEHWNEYRQVMDSAKKMGIRSSVFAEIFALDQTESRPAPSSGRDGIRYPQQQPFLDAVLQCARQLGLQLGGYFSPMDRGGDRWTNDDFTNPARRDWIIERSEAAIREYDMGYWSNDFMEFNLEDERKNYGHITAAGAVYMQWRNLVDIYRQIRGRYPDINIGVFGGLTSCGPWSLQYADYANLPGQDSHPNTFCPFPDIHYNHLFGNEERMRSWYGHNLLFYPPYKCRYSVGHMGQDGLHVSGDPFGWRMSFLGALGTSTMLEYAYIPIGAEIKEEDIKFMNKWIVWANRNLKYLRVRKDLFGEPAIGRVDGYAHVIGDRGFIFLFNPNHRTIAVKFPLNEWIGLTGGKTFLIKELYPWEGRIHYIDHDNGLAVYGREVTLNVSPQGVQILEITPATGGPFLFGVAGTLRSLSEGEVELAELSAEEGQEATVAVRVSTPVKQLRLKGKSIPYKRLAKNLLVAKLRFKGEQIRREIRQWTGNGKKIPIPNIHAESHVQLKCRFYLPSRVSRILAAQKPLRKVSPEDTVRSLNLESALQQLATSDPYERIPTLDPSRLLITLPTTYPEKIEGLRGWLNGSEVAVKRFESTTLGPGHRLFCYYLDITPQAKYGVENELSLEVQELQKGQFLGGYLENLPVQLAESAIAVNPGDSSPLEEPAGKPLEAFPD